MPELPEVETIRTQLADKLIGRKIISVDIRLPKIWEGEKEKIVRQKIKDVRRRAKIIIISLENGFNIVVHLKMTGQLVVGSLRDQSKSKKDASYAADTISFHQGIQFAGFSLPAKTTHVILDLDSGLRLFFNDMRQFGWMKVMSNEQLAIINEKHGPEALGKDFTEEYLAKICSNWGRPIKILLMEQSKIAGIGNIYANEALWCAGISPMKRGRELVSLRNQSKSKENGKTKIPEKIQKLYDCIKEVLEKGLKYGGSSAADEAFVNVLGEKGHMQEHFVVYQKNGQPCPRCGKTITRSTLGGRGTFFCPKCQK